jgi:uncharacterized protein involved in exopolysaccharide biosynthesis
MRTQLQTLERDDARAPGRRSDDYITRYREFKYYETLQELFARQYEMARADEASNGAMLQVVAPAETPESKSRPRRGLMALAAVLLGFVACVVWVMGGWAMSRVSQDPEGAAKVDALRDALRLRG